MEGGDSLPRPSTESAVAAAPPDAESQSSDLATVRSDNVVVSGDAEVPSSLAVMVNPAAGSSISLSGEKRKRGRPPKGQTATVVVKSPPPKRNKEEEEEDVCFICFDGGSLVLCDRKWCPKAYHPACIKRDEAFFQSKAKWNCGWHICSVCEKNAHYTCYTCTYSLCKGCTKDADYVRVRGTNGFCITCMKTIMLIENKDHANKELVQVDFDDKSSWEYLFKVYWVCLKDKLSLTLDELTQAKNPWKGVASYKKQLPHPQHVVNHGTKLVSNGPHEHLELKKPKELGGPSSDDCLSSEKLCHDKITEKTSTENDVSLAGTVEWASKELLEFVAHMKSGDASVVSQFDVQALLQEYINKNNLRDPHKKSQIICDLRLKNLFQKPRVGHIEMLKLLEYHFLIIEDSKKNAFIPAGIVGAHASHYGSDENNEDSLLGNKNKRRNTRKKVEDKAPQNNLDEYAAIDVHNINLIYMRRNLMVTLIEDDKLQDKVVGSIVRIRILSNDQKQDTYRLVQVVGTSKVAVSYKIGEKPVNIMLEVLNLDKKESIAIDAISNQEFSEDECRRLRQSIRCGLVKRLTVGEIQKKAMDLQALRFNDRLEAEILKLNHLRDRASEKGRKKELRECVEKLQLLKSPEERQRRLCEICEVHTDPKMNPDYVSEEDSEGHNDKKQDEYGGQTHSPFSRSGSRSITSKRKVHPVKEEGLLNSHHKSNQKKDAGVSNDQSIVRSGPEVSTAIIASGSPSSSNSSENEKLWHYRDPNGNIQGPFSMLQLRKWSTTGYFPPDMRIWINNERDDSVLLTDALSGHFDAAAHLLYNLSLPRQEVVAAPSDNRIYNSDVRGIEKVASHSSSSRVLFIDNNESIKTDGLGSTTSNCTTSVVSHKEMQPQNSQYGDRSKDNNSSSDHIQAAPSNVGQKDVALPHQGQGHGSNNSCSDHIQAAPSNVGQKDVALPHQEQGHGSNSSCSDHIQAPPSNVGQKDVALPHQGQGHGSNNSLSDHIQALPSNVGQKDVALPHQEQGHGSNNSSSDHIQATPSNVGQKDVALPHPGLGHVSEGSARDTCHENQVSSDGGAYQKTDGQSHENQSDGMSNLCESSGQNRRSFPININLNEMDTNSGFSPVRKSDSTEQNGDIDLHQLASPTPRSGNIESEGQTAEKLQPPSSDVPIQTSDIPGILGLTLKPIDESQGTQGAGCRQFLPPKYDGQDSGRSWSSASNIEVGGAQLPDLAAEWGGYSPTPAKPHAEAWSSGLVSMSSVKQPEAVRDHATPTSHIDPVAPTSPSHPTPNASGWHGVMEPIEFTTLAEESMSDLLAEVDAMESQNGLPSPTSALRCGDDMMKGCKDDYFGSLEDFSPTRDHGKTDALSSTGDIQIPSRSTVTNEPVGLFLADAYNPLKRSNGQSSTSREGETKSAYVAASHREAGSLVHPLPSRIMSRDTTNTTMSLSTGMEGIDTGWGRVPVNVNLDWGASAQGVVNIDRGPNQGMAWGTQNVNRGPFGGGVVWDEQRTFSGERYPVPRAVASQGVDLGYGRGRPFWNRPPMGGVGGVGVGVGVGVGGGSGGGGGYSRQPPKGQRVCKFYESGNCKRGASCGYLHP